MTARRAKQEKLYWQLEGLLADLAISVGCSSREEMFEMGQTFSWDVRLTAMRIIDAQRALLKDMMREKWPKLKQV